MTKRRLIRWSLILLILAAFAVWLEPTRVLWGWLRGEAFYQGRPTSYWRGAIERDLQMEPRVLRIKMFAPALPRPQVGGIEAELGSATGFPMRHPNGLLPGEKKPPGYCKRWRRIRTTESPVLPRMQCNTARGWFRRSIGWM